MRDKSRSLEDEAKELRRTNGFLKLELDDLKADIAKEMLLQEHVRKSSDPDAEGPKMLERSKALAQYQESSRSSFFWCGRAK
mmetsp:Transcript_146042/g.280026  ORF Transcript_146042/g.280026 Transcript_146042/m.280026 type:complete len:82 (+) Transcript_146042:82-327(+)